MIIITIVSLGSLEVILRTEHLFNARISWAKPDHLIGWRNNPLHEYWINNENDHPATSVQRIFRQDYEKRHIPLHWGHWNYEGHKVVANALAEKLGTIIYSDMKE